MYDHLSRKPMLAKLLSTADVLKKAQRDIDFEKPANILAEVVAMSNSVEAQDKALERQAVQSPSHMESLVNRLDARLTAQHKKLTHLSEVNHEIQRKIELRQMRNAELQERLNSTRERIEKVTRDLRVLAANISRSGDYVDLVLDERLENVQHYSKLASSLMQVHDSPDESIKRIGSSLEDMHLHAEKHVVETFKETYIQLIETEKKLRMEHKKLNATLIDEDRLGVILDSELERLGKLLDRLSKKRSALQAIASKLLDLVQYSKADSLTRSEFRRDDVLQAAGNGTFHSTQSLLNASGKRMSRHTFVDRLIHASKHVMKSAGSRVVGSVRRVIGNAHKHVAVGKAHKEAHLSVHKQNSANMSGSSKSSTHARPKVQHKLNVPSSVETSSAGVVRVELEKEYAQQTNTTTTQASKDKSGIASTNASGVDHVQKMSNLSNAHKELGALEATSEVVLPRKIHHIIALPLLR
eukprot:TRINITY_DN17719_c0_g1_i1.p1 TRINITY_DN17719_c0_g1~~TRINITY_DN17719_c0_g1_i1.p1  ORF type:complete len:534 (+),score=69.46 TRINITY_DN17719_c0_g1_i1:196-1602(+)